MFFRLFHMFLFMPFFYSKFNKQNLNIFDLQMYTAQSLSEYHLLGRWTFAALIRQGH